MLTGNDGFEEEEIDLGFEMIQEDAQDFNQELRDQAENAHLNPGVIPGELDNRMQIDRRNLGKKKTEI